MSKLFIDAKVEYQSNPMGSDGYPIHEEPITFSVRCFINADHIAVVEEFFDDKKNTKDSGSEITLVNGRKFWVDLEYDELCQLMRQFYENGSS